MVDLPRPEIKVETTIDRLDVVVSRDGKGRSYRSEKPAIGERVKDIVEKIINDTHTAEWLP